MNSFPQICHPRSRTRQRAKQKKIMKPRHSALTTNICIVLATLNFHQCLFCVGSDCHEPLINLLTEDHRPWASDDRPAVSFPVRNCRLPTRACPRWIVVRST